MNMQIVYSKDSPIKTPEFILQNASVVGTLNNNAGVYSGFSENNFIRTNISLNYISGFKFLSKLETGDISSPSKVIFSRNTNTSSAIDFYLQASSKTLSVWDGSNSYTGTNVLSSYTTYWVLVENKNGVLSWYSDDGSHSYLNKDRVPESSDSSFWRLENSITSDLFKGINIDLGYNVASTNQFWSGKIDINNTYFKIDDQIIIFGSTENQSILYNLSFNPLSPQPEYTVISKKAIKIDNKIYTKDPSYDLIKWEYIGEESGESGDSGLIPESGESGFIPESGESGEESGSVPESGESGYQPESGESGYEPVRLVKSYQATEFGQYLQTAEAIPFNTANSWQIDLDWTYVDDFVNSSYVTQAFFGTSTENVTDVINFFRERSGPTLYLTSGVSVSDIGDIKYDRTQYTGTDYGRFPINGQRCIYRLKFEDNIYSAYVSTDNGETFTQFDNSISSSTKVASSVPLQFFKSEVDISRYLSKGIINCENSKIYINGEVYLDFTTAESEGKLINYGCSKVLADLSYTDKTISYTSYSANSTYLELTEVIPFNTANTWQVDLDISFNTAKNGTSGTTSPHCFLGSSTTGSLMDTLDFLKEMQGPKTYLSNGTTLSSIGVIAANNSSYLSERTRCILRLVFDGSSYKMYGKKQGESEFTQLGSTVYSSAKIASTATAWMFKAGYNNNYGCEDTLWCENSKIIIDGQVWLDFTTAEADGRLVNHGCNKLIYKELEQESGIELIEL